MITKFKIFEAFDDKIGYYVILDDPRYSEFLKNNVGVITKVYYPGSWFDVKFDNLPKELEIFLKDRNFHVDHIKHISKDKETLEAIIQSQKYNI